MCICTYTCIYVPTYAYVYVRIRMCMFVLMYTYMFGCVYMRRNHRNEWWVPAKCLEVRRKLKNLIEVVCILFGSNLLHLYALIDSIYMLLCLYVCAHVNVYLCICGWVHLWMSLYVMRACMHACMHACVHVCMRARVDVHV